MADATITVDELADLLVSTGHRHHEAYAVSDGADPEWALWYAGSLQTHLWNRAGTLPTRSLLVRLLLNAEAEFLEAGGEGAWAPSYARHILDALAAD